MSGKFLQSIQSNVHLNTFAGHYVPDYDQVIEWRWSKRLLILWRVVGDLCTAITVVTLSVRLFSADVDVAERCNGVFTTITAVQGALKGLHFVRNKQRFEKLFEMLDESLNDIPCKEQHEKAMRSERRKVKIISGALLALMVGPAIPYGLLPFLSFAQEAHGGRYLAVPAWFPFDSLASPMFEMVLIFQTFGGFFTISRSVTFDIFFISIVSFKVVHANNLKMCIRKMFRVPRRENEPNLGSIAGVDACNADAGLGEGMFESHFTDVSNIVTQFSNTRTDYDLPTAHLYAQRIKFWVQYHQKMARVGREIQELYSSIFAMQFITSLLILCFSSFVAATVSLEFMQYLLLAIFCFGNILQLFLLCHYGDRVADADFALSDAAFGNGWHKCYIKGIASSLKIIHQRIQRPLQLTAWGLLPLSSVTFRDITNTAFSYLMVLNELYEKEPVKIDGKLENFD